MPYEKRLERSLEWVIWTRDRFLERNTAIMSGYISPQKKVVNDLLVDKVISGPQIVRRYKINPENISAHTVELALRPTQRSRRIEVVTFYCASAAIARLPSSELMDYAGLGEMRRELGAAADPEIWMHEMPAKIQRRLRETERVVKDRPDAYWYFRDEGDKSYKLVLIEYNTGSYSRKRIESKVKHYWKIGMIRQIWGCPSKRVADNVRSIIDPIFKGTQVIVARWD